MTTGEIERQVGNIGFWSIHLLRVSFFVLLAIASGLFLIRLGLSALVSRRVGREAVFSSSPRRLAGNGFLALGVFLASGLFALRPDEHFHLTIADAAFAAGDYGGAAAYYEPVAAWGTRRADVYVKLGFSALKLRRYRLAAQSFERAVALDPKHRRDTRELSALAQLGLGEAALAVPYLEEALSLAEDPAEKHRLERLLAEVRGPRP